MAAKYLIVHTFYSLLLFIWDLFFMSNFSALALDFCYSILTKELIMKKAILALAMLVVGSTALATSLKFDVDQCLDNAQSNVEMKECVYEEYRLQDLKLNSVYKRLMAKLKADKSEEGAEIVRRVTAAQKAWITVRDTTCAVEGIDMLNGTGEGLIVGGCMGRITRERVAYLSELEENLTNSR